MRNRKAIAAALSVLAAGLVAGCTNGPVSSPGLPGYGTTGNTAVLQPGRQLALNEPVSKYCYNDWTVTFDGTSVHINLASGSDNCNGSASTYSAAVTGTKANPTRINISSEGVTFSAWTAPGTPGAVVLWPYGWDKE
jgi:hypothetical protein